MLWLLIFQSVEVIRFHVKSPFLSIHSMVYISGFIVLADVDHRIRFLFSKQLSLVEL